VSVERVMRAVVAIERDLDATLSLPELADHACLSPFHFHRLFTAVVGEPPAEYVRRLRLERAAHELSTSHRAMRKAPCVEIYLTPPERTPPAELLTEVLVPIR
jgi:AraC family transcriptional regulator